MTESATIGDGKWPAGGKRRARWDDALASLRDTPRLAILVGLLAVFLLTLLMLPFRDRLGILNVLLLYLLLTIAVALGGGVWPGILAALFGFLAFNFVFIPPYYTFHVAAADHGLALVVYLGVAIGTASLVSRARARTEEAERESRRMALLADLNAALIGDVTLDAILARIAERVVTVYGARGCRVLVRGDDGELRTGAFSPRTLGPDVDRTGLSLAEWAMAHRQPIGRSGRGGRIVGRRSSPSGSGSVGAAGGDALYLPIRTKDRVFGVLEVIGRPGAAPYHAEREQTLTTFVDQAALALERARLSEEAARAAVHAESDALKSALLSAVSHDLRTPLASIKAAATSLLDDTIAWDAETRRELLTAIDEETDRLTLMVSNLLDLSRIEGGALRPRQDWYDVDELLADVQERMAARTERHPVTVRIDPMLPSLRFDYVQIAQVVVNLLENAVKYAPEGTPIVVTAKRLPDAVEIAVHDDGPGIPAEQQLRLFDRFYRAPAARSIPGAGIGLTISKGLVEANGGRIAVESAPGYGTTFRFTLPLPPAAGATTADSGAAA
jgi:two-component system, OmpR family, sensor histidine kinase KdpD